MAKDFAESWEQKCWEWESSRHRRMVELLKITTNPKVIAFATELKEAAEKKYPSLKTETSNSSNQTVCN